MMPQPPWRSAISPLLLLGNPGMCVGTATVLRPGLAVTAKHVLEDMVGSLDHVDRPRSISAALSVAVWRSDNKGSVDWRVRSISPSPFTDVAFLHLETENALRQELAPPAIPISFMFPELGEPLTACGFPNSSVETTKDGGTLTLKLHYNAVQSTGRVMEVHFQRDTVMYPFPVIRTNATFDGGMSGGPVFDHRGVLRAIVCGGADGVPDLNYAALLWPAALTVVEISIHDGTKEFMTISEAASRGILAIDGAEHVSSSKAESSISVHWSGPHPQLPLIERQLPDS